MILAHSEPAKPKRTFKDLKDTFIPDVSNGSHFQHLLLDPHLANQNVPVEIWDTLLTMTRTLMSQISHQKPQNNFQSLHASTQQLTPKVLQHQASEFIQQFSSWSAARFQQSDQLSSARSINQKPGSRANRNKPLISTSFLSQYTWRYQKNVRYNTN